MAEQSVLEIILNFRRQGEGVKQASAELREFGSKSKELSGITSILTASKIALAGAIVGVGLAAIRQIPLLVEMGDQYQRSRMALEAYTGSAGAAQLALMAVANASGGAVDQLAASQNATRLFAMGLANTAAEAEELTRIAVTLGAAVGRDAKSSFEDFTMLLANQSILRLDQFGLSSAKVRERIRELQEANAGLTREMAFQQAVMEMGREKLEQLDAAGFEAANNWQRLSAEVRNFGIFLGTTINDAVDPWLDRLFEATDRNRDLAMQIFANTDNFTEYKAAMQEAHLVGGFFSQGIGFTSEELYNQAKAAEAATVSNEDLSVSYSVLALAEEEAKAQLQGLHQLMSIDITRDFDAVQEKIAEQQEQIAEWRGRVAELEGMSYLTDEQRSELDGLREKIAEAEEKVGDLEEAWDRQTKQLIFKLVEQKLALDGFTQQEIDALARLAGPEGFGLIDQAAVDLIHGVDEVSAAFTVGSDEWTNAIVNGLHAPLRDAQGEISAVQGQWARWNPPSKELTVVTTNVTRNIQQFMTQNLGVIQSVRAAQGGFLQHGGQFDVQGPPGPDRVPVQMNLTAGERVTVTPRGGLAPANGGRGEGPLIGQVNVNNQMDAVLLAHLLKRELG